MALQNLHEMIRNLSSYIKSLEVLCESGVRLAKNFERLLSPGPMLFSGIVASSSGLGSTQHLDSDVLTQSVATWELAHKVATADANALISELLPLLQETVQNVMKDPTSFHSTNTYEVFRSCFSAFFQIQWRFCSLYLQCTSSQGGSQQTGTSHHSYFPRTPDCHMAHSPTTASFSSSGGDRRESTESCMSGFSMPRSSISSGLSALSSRSTSPSSQGGTHHSHHYGAGHNTRSRNSSPSVKFTPSQPPSPLMPYGEGGYPSLFRRWSTHTHNYAGNTSSTGTGPGSSTGGASAFSSCGSSGSNSGFNPVGFSRRWSVPASAGQNQGGSTSADSIRRNESSDSFDYGLLDAINLLSFKPPSPATVKIDESDHEFEAEQTTSLWPPSEKMPGVVLTTCGSESESGLTLEDLQRSSHQSLHVRFGTAETSTMSQPVTTSIQAQPGEYSLFGNPSSGGPQGP